MKAAKILSLFAFLSLSAFSSSAYAGGPCKNVMSSSSITQLRSRSICLWKHSLREAGVSTSDRKKMEAALRTLEPYAQSIRDTGVGVAMDVAQLLRADDIDKEAMEELRQETVALVDDSSKAVLETGLTIFSMMDAEQRNIFLDSIEDNLR